MERIDIKSMDMKELQSFIEAMGEKKFRAKQLYSWMHQKLVTDFDEMTNLSKAFRDRLKEKCSLGGVQIRREQISKKDGLIDFTRSAAAIKCQIRGLNPWPSAYTHLDGKMLKLWDADVKAQEQTPAAKPGQIVEVGKDYFTVQTGRDLLVIRSLQLEGKKRMDTEAFLRGYSLTEESILS